MATKMRMECMECGHKFEARENGLVTTIKCRKCGSWNTLPALD